jgi:hypothetical protein
MTLTIELTPAQEASLRVRASQKGLDTAEYARRVLLSEIAETSQEDRMPTNGAELVAYWERLGVIGSRPDITDSLEHARQLRERAQTRSRDT